MAIFSLKHPEGVHCLKSSTPSPIFTSSNIILAKQLVDMTLNYYDGDLDLYAESVLHFLSNLLHIEEVEVE